MDRFDDGLTRVNTGYGRPRFSRLELRDILISVAVLAIAFALIYRSGSVMDYLEWRTGSETAAFACLLGLSALLVVVSFLFHEFGHKFTAQRAGLWSEYRMYPMGLVLSLVMSFLGFLFAAPGAVYIHGNMDARTNGRVSIAGPVVNIVLAGIGIAGCFATNHTPLVFVFIMLANLNAFLAVVNLLPIPPLDGSKVLTWNKAVWVCAMGAAALELVYLMGGFMPALYWA